MRLVVIDEIHRLDPRTTTGADQITTERTALPLLSRVLLETWRRRQGRTLTLDATNELADYRDP
ncbi:hypothetical protein ACFU9B_44160 [Streptomyces sp. NPDC057592]|uniref:hypothetical protein n=1 Tax=unclassified Streptomyces TaxID=2593676 RepID=UPI0036D1DEA7